MIKRFTLGAVEWTVEVANTRGDDREAYGATFYDESKILLQDTTLGKPRASTAIEQTLYHEIVHAILDTLGKRELSKDEEFIQSFSLLLHQFEKTKQ